MSPLRKLYPMVGNTISCCYGHFLCGYVFLKILYIFRFLKTRIGWRVVYLFSSSYFWRSVCFNVCILLFCILSSSFWAIYSTIPLWLFILETVVGILPPLFFCHKVHTTDPGILPRGYLLPKNHPLLKPPKNSHHSHLV
jgi:TctA family transporter